MPKGLERQRRRGSGAMKPDAPDGASKGAQWMARALRRPEQFTILLIAILCFLVIPPFFINYRSTGMLASLFLSMLLLSVLYVFPAGVSLSLPVWLRFRPLRDDGS